ncbi:MAG: hypothetical protein A3B34_02290 [Candidatus Sungbacteria bacterium RIFCSPLOWO2_01_FULL_54_21]|uniref:Phosphatidic acid phosphatase type 2/haloperoxidase domain-containing protein n=2 Tax=Candidatus Sungiibacteriota TaxID=1817917 RepID=A0A1G2L8Z3_9BACT|nr:MAG: hypothetical protein A2679_01020 [Candidatus Sungbacteria bacterium RIFCSPHIGHO2_01_FULL_54_26]OHA03977.1 MAG: hypothetical protein A3C92_02205 [Candidatus Sungbacteria bacterium RIFCSPHIGHO2_02_FULL_53_17]OHA08103.1 MAG: hypothetical protein A3B34_02290 [Candidatus Sungbacteria bacterium RIFCSPLOWO2_01_FULL_54_21]
MIYGFDQAVFNYLHSWAGVFPTLDAVLIFSAVYLLYAMIAGVLTYAILGYFFRAHDMRQKARLCFWLAATSSVIARVVIAEPLRMLVARSRPFEAWTLPRQLIDHAIGHSFPSGHATLAFAIAAAVFAYHRKAGLLLFGAAGLIGISRVIAGVHWPSDIVGGAIIGVAGAWISGMALRRKGYFFHREHST